MSYRGRSKGNYDTKRRRSSSRGRSKSKRLQSDTKTARRNFEKRSTRSQVQDLIRMAPLAPNLEVYLKAPNRYDFPNVDTPDPKLIFSHKTHRQQAVDLAKLATKAPVEIWIRNTARHDIQNVDTPGSKRAVIPERTHKFKVTRKSKAKEETEKEEEEEKAIGQQTLISETGTTGTTGTTFIPKEKYKLEKSKEIEPSKTVPTVPTVPKPILNVYHVYNGEQCGCKKFAAEYELHDTVEDTRKRYCESCCREKKKWFVEHGYQLVYPARREQP